MLLHYLFIYLVSPNSNLFFSIILTYSKKFPNGLLANCVSSVLLFWSAKKLSDIISFIFLSFLSSFYIYQQNCKSFCLFPHSIPLYGGWEKRELSLFLYILLYNLRKVFKRWYAIVERTWNLDSKVMGFSFPSDSCDLNHARNFYSLSFFICKRWRWIKPTPWIVREITRYLQNN